MLGRKVEATTESKTPKGVGSVFTAEMATEWSELLPNLDGIYRFEVGIGWGGMVSVDSMSFITLFTQLANERVEYGGRFP